jgi:hypothetical protein
MVIIPVMSRLKRTLDRKFFVLASSGVRHASLKARIRKIKMRCAGFAEVQVEETYSMLLLDEGQGSAVPEVLALPGSFSPNSEGKCLRKRTIASSTRPDNI